MVEDVLISMKDEMVKTLMDMISIVAISPSSGGKGELERAEFLEKKIMEIGPDLIERVDAKDENGFVRPNIIAKMYGENKEKTIWIVAHMDTVPEGDRSLWEHDPFVAYVKDGKIYGRGSEDNGQSLVGALYAFKAIKISGIKPKNSIGLIFVSDEEMGSKYGLEYVINNYKFGDKDEFLVPDSGNEDGTEVEISEKGILWFSIIVNGKQGHASRPDLSLNAHRIGIDLARKIDEKLHKKYNKIDDLFIPPYSTFEPTKKEANVPNVNTIPGKDVFYFDCRILPSYSIDSVIDDIKKICAREEKYTGAKIDFNILQRADSAGTTDKNSEVVQKLLKTLREKRKIEPKLVGIGGGTCAAILRRKGYPAVVWSTLDPVEHSPNEYCKIENLINDAIVFAQIFSS
ncbi:MAG: M20 family metallo-hydrolase [Thermoplasmata archaeon]